MSKFKIGDRARCIVGGYHENEVGTVVHIWNGRLPYEVYFDGYSYDETHRPGFNADELELVEPDNKPLPLPG